MHRRIIVKMYDLSIDYDGDDIRLQQDNPSSDVGYDLIVISKCQITAVIDYLQNILKEEKTEKVNDLV